MLPSLAPVSALETRLGLAVGSLTGADLARAETDLADASALVRMESFGKTWVDTDGVTVTAPDSVVTVVVRAAIRSYRNPDGFQGEAVGSGAYSYQYAQGEVGMYLTPEEIRVVRYAARAAGTGGVSTIRVRSAYFDAPTDDPAADPNTSFVFGGF